MAISVTCDHCHARLQADDKLADKYVNCSSCGARIYIEPPRLEGDTLPASSSTSSYQLSPLEDQLPSSSPSAASDRLGPASPAAKCVKCGASLPPGQEHCRQCFYHSGLNRIIDTRDDLEEGSRAVAFGFRKYLQGKLSRGQSPESVFYLFDFFFCLVLLAFAVWLSIPIYIGLVLVGVHVTYRAFVVTTGSTHRGASILWLTFLFFGRSLEWKTLGGTSRLACTRRGAAFEDSHLGALENLDQLQVLDLAGTGVTDAGLALLEHHGHLEFLILRKTSVSSEAVWELQQTIPGTCIWH